MSWWLLVRCHEDHKNQKCPSILDYRHIHGLPHPHLLPLVPRPQPEAQSLWPPLVLQPEASLQVSGLSNRIKTGYWVAELRELLLQRHGSQLPFAYSECFLVSNRTFAYWKSLHTVTISYSDTFDKLHQCHCNRSSLYGVSSWVKLFTVSHNDGRHELRVAKADHDQRSPVGGEEESFRFLGNLQRDHLQHYRVVQRNMTPELIEFVFFATVQGVQCWNVFLLICCESTE